MGYGKNQIFQNRFLEELKTPKFPFEINWPLVHSYFNQASLFCKFATKLVARMTTRMIECYRLSCHLLSLKRVGTNLYYFKMSVKFFKINGLEEF